MTRTSTDDQMWFGEWKFAKGGRVALINLGIYRGSSKEEGMPKSWYFILLVVRAVPRGGHCGVYNIKSIQFPF